MLLARPADAPPPPARRACPRHGPPSSIGDHRPGRSLEAADLPTPAPSQPPRHRAGLAVRAGGRGGRAGDRLKSAALFAVRLAPSLAPCAGERDRPRGFRRAFRVCGQAGRPSSWSCPPTMPKATVPDIARLRRTPVLYRPRSRRSTPGRSPALSQALSCTAIRAVSAAYRLLWRLSRPALPATRSTPTGCRPGTWPRRSVATCTR